MSTTIRTKQTSPHLMSIALKGYVHIWNRELSADEINRIMELVRLHGDIPNCDCDVCRGDKVEYAPFWGTTEPVNAFETHPGWLFSGDSVALDKEQP